MLVKGKIRYHFCKDCARIIQIRPDMVVSPIGTSKSVTDCDLCEEEHVCKPYKIQ